MTGFRVTEEELSAFIDGELPPARAKAVAQVLAQDASLAAQAEAFRRDRDGLRGAFAPVAEAAVPAAWLRRIEAAVEQPSAKIVTLSARRRSPVLAAPLFAWAIAACLVLAVGLGVMQLRLQGPEDALLAEALDARSGALAAVAHYTEAALPAAEAQRVLLTKATGLPVRAPDLRRQGWHLTAVDTYRDAAALQYANASGQSLFVFVRRSAGAPRFDILKRHADRICVWQDEVVAAVMMGDMSAGQMMRVAGAAYASLDL
jgi:anti-sigma factor RsiW